MLALAQVPEDCIIDDAVLLSRCVHAKILEYLVQIDRQTDGNWLLIYHSCIGFIGFALQMYIQSSTYARK